MAVELALDRRFQEKCILGILFLGIVSSHPASDQQTCQARSVCQDHNVLTPGPLSAKATPRDGDYMRPDQSYAMSLCVEGYTSLIWSKREFAVHQPHRPFPWGSRGALCRQNQSLAFTSLVPEDSGFYRVIFSNGTHELTKVFFLSVDQNPTEVEQVTPYIAPPRHVQARIGDNVTLDCSGYYGTGDRNLQTLEWMLYENSTLVDIPTNSHYYVEYTPRNESLRSGRLHVLGVRQEDFHKTFLCRMTTAIEGNQFSYNATFVHPDTGNRMYSFIIGGGVAFACILIVVWLLYWKKKQYVRYLCARLKPRGKLEHDVFLFSHEDNMAIAQRSLQPRLEAMGLKVCEYHRDTLGNRQEVELQEEQMRLSACTLLVLSSSDLDSHNTDTLVSMATKKGHRVVVVYLESPRVFQENLRQCPSDEQQNIRKVTQFFRCFEWPGNEDDGKVERFWNKLRRRGLPRPAASTDHRRDDRPSSSQPLISSVSSAERAEPYFSTYSPTTDSDEVFADPVEEEEEDASMSVDMGRWQGEATPGRRDTKPLKQQVSEDSGFASIAEHSPPCLVQPV